MCRKLSLNVKTSALKRKSSNDGSNTPLLNDAAQCSEIMGRLSNQSPRFSASKTSENDMNNNNCASLVNPNTTTNHPNQDCNAVCALLGLIGNCTNLDNKLKYCFQESSIKNMILIIMPQYPGAINCIMQMKLSTFAETKMRSKGKKL